MIHVHDAIRQRLLKDVEPPKKRPTLDELRKSEWCDVFEEYMRNRLIMGAYRYGPMAESADKEYDRIGYLRKKLEIYEQTGNLEMLVDVANLALLEFKQCKHPKAHFEAQDGGGGEATRKVL